MWTSTWGLTPSPRPPGPDPLPPPCGRHKWMAPISILHHFFASFVFNWKEKDHPTFASNEPDSFILETYIAPLQTAITMQQSENTGYIEQLH